ncbi:hypothetical protein Q766_09125 [Flavobacterium subsaxonicum WB 4.1-42 = DSM 21790]|uniref:Suppressor of fused-like domain-containing protein n=1 Tax=Flavobacterium subsaxonicum WB 4.1-42 = DSM 21790 TaxID=1121898 RepID=A0A0A2MYZ3_9FLAO|nr:hypothetical protein Q766_09125 [Flavobacterium subsaxonicum WB 4.1-42 = DSM 21790]
MFKKEPLYYMEESLSNGLPGVASIVYKDIPEQGYTTAFTYGLSLAQHPEWKFGRPELCVSVASLNPSWERISAYIANRLRGDCPFKYGQNINFGEKISDDSEMDAFFIFAPSTLNKEDYSNIDIGADYKINIVGLYPMYADELDAYEKMGLEKFWHHPNFDNYNVNRKHISL